MAFGLSNTQTSFQSYINNILANMLNVFVIVYLEIILIYNNKTNNADSIGWLL